eukprot:scaffold414278_cov18-Prasinocladus_malaysianus.AAC.1
MGDGMECNQEVAACCLNLSASERVSVGAVVVSTQTDAMLRPNDAKLLHSQLQPSKVTGKQTSGNAVTQHVPYQHGR